jgi:uncharacterized membrane protein
LTELTPQDIIRREELTFKLQNRSLKYEEAQELKNILQKEKEKAISLNDIFALLAIAFFSSALVTFLSDLEKKIKKKKFFIV